MIAKFWKDAAKTVPEDNHVVLGYVTEGRTPGCEYRGAHAFVMRKNGKWIFEDAPEFECKVSRWAIIPGADA